MSAGQPSGQGGQKVASGGQPLGLLFAVCSMVPHRCHQWAGGGQGGQKGGQQVGRVATQKPTNGQHLPSKITSDCGGLFQKRPLSPPLSLKTFSSARVKAPLVNTGTCVRGF